MEKTYLEIEWIKTKVLKFFSKENNKNILILHWWWWKSESWINFSNQISKKWFNVFVPDLPWFWETTLPKVFNLDDYRDFIKNLIIELDLKDFYLMWHSNWWAISMKLSLISDLKIKKLILNNSAWIRNEPKVNFKRKVLKLISLIFKPLKSFSFFKHLRIIFYKIIWNYDYVNSLKIPFLEETYKNIISEDLQNIMENISTETLLIRWENDKFTPISYWKKINSLIKYSKMIIIPWEWHSIHLKNPEILALELLKNC